MKNAACFLFLSIFLLAFSCDEGLQKKIDELHSSSMLLSDEFAPMMEELNQRAISINIQGRELTAEEISFVGNVSALETDYNSWKADMESAMSMESGKERLQKEQSVNAGIQALKQKAAELMGSN